MRKAQQIVYLPGLHQFVMEEKDRRGVTYEKIAEEAGIDNAQFANLYNLKRGASLAIALRLATRYRTTVEHLTQAQAATEKNSA